MSDTNKKQVKLTLEDLINKKLQKNSTEIIIKNIYVEKAGGELEFHIPSFKKLLEYTNDIKGGREELYEMNKKLIYDCCEMLHSKELRDAYKVKDPYDIISYVFSDLDIMTVGEKIIESRNMQKEDEEAKK